MSARRIEIAAILFFLLYALTPLFPKPPQYHEDLTHVLPAWFTGIFPSFLLTLMTIVACKTIWLLFINHVGTESLYTRILPVMWTLFFLTMVVMLACEYWATKRPLPAYDFTSLLPYVAFACGDFIHMQRARWNIRNFSEYSQSIAYRKFLVN